MNKGFLFWGKRWLTLKIGVEIRCCLSFFLMLFYYCVYRLMSAVTQASILHMAQMMLMAYAVGWVQALTHTDYDQIDGLGAREWGVMAFASIAYGAAGWGFGWFGGNAAAAWLFPAYMAGCALSTYLICRIKRAIDGKGLNEDLKAFQGRTKESEGDS